MIHQRQAELISKSKHICKQNRILRLTKQILLVILIALFLPRVAPAHAAGLSLKDLQRKLSEVKSSVIFNQSEEKNKEKNSKKENQKKDEKKASKKVPKIVEDPKKIEEAVEFASQVTGVRKDFLMGMLVVESDLGRNTGECTYKEVEDGAQNAHDNGQLGDRAWNTFLERKAIIEDIAASIGYDYEKLTVSCNPDISVYAGTGGAMGIPQFMPDTWIEYKDRIKATVGKENPDPWDIKDGVVAMALKLSDVPGVIAHNVWSERNAAKMYLSGTTSWRYDWYANQIAYWSLNYRKVMG